MGGRVATVLLMLSLVAGCLSAADVDTIRLPSQDGAVKAGEEERPWKCCTRALCTKSFPPFCKCLDMVEKCSGACKNCRAEREQESDPEGFICDDWFHGDPGPDCDTNDKAVADEVTITAVAVAEEERPWKCCNDTLCNRSAPPTCRCLDSVDHCADTCKECRTATSDPSRHVCRDRFHGWPGPKCITSNDHE